MIEDDKWEALKGFMTPDVSEMAHDRANDAKEDYLAQLPGDLYRQAKDDILAVWDLLESPIEQVAIFQLAGANYAYKGDPVYAKVCRERGQFSHVHHPVQIIPQAKFGPYRVDFLVDIGSRGLLAVECDGEEFHQDKDRDKARDEHLSKHFGVGVLRAPGRDIWKSNQRIEFFVSVIQARRL